MTTETDLRALNAEVAEEVMKCASASGGAEIAAAWDVVEALHRKGWAVEINYDGWGSDPVRIIVDGGAVIHRVEGAKAASMPEAVCRAALKAIAHAS